MAALSTVADYLNDARVLLQDTGTPARYSDDELVAALNVSMFEAKRIRPDLFIGITIPTYTTADTSAAVEAVNEIYRLAHLDFIVGRAQLRDDEATTDQRATAFLLMFETKLKSV